LSPSPPAFPYTTLFRSPSAKPAAQIPTAPSTIDPVEAMKATMPSARRGGAGTGAGRAVTDPPYRAATYTCTVSLSGILRALEKSDSFREAFEATSVDADVSLVDGLDAPGLAELLERRRAAGRPAVLLAIAPTSRRAESLAAALRALVADAAVRELPAWETLPHERLSPSPETVGRRLETFRALTTWDGSQPLIVTASIRAAIQPIVRGLGLAEPISLRVGGRDLWLEEVTERLVELAYHRVDMVSRRGDFAVRGGILDV